MATTTAAPTGKIIQMGGGVQFTQLATGAALQVGMNILHPGAREQAGRSSVGKAPDHGRMIAEALTRVYGASLIYFRLL